MKMKHLNYAITMALGAGLVAPQLAQASHFAGALFPYVVKDTNRTTVITLIANTAQEGGGGGTNTAGLHVHLQYWTKDTTAANTAACQPNSSSMIFTVNDMATWDTAGLLGTATNPTLFGDTTTKAPLGASISFAGPRHGYLVAEARNPDGSYFEENTLRGYWVELDFASGTALASHALNDNINPFDGDFDHESRLQTTSNVGIDSDSAAVAFWPVALVSTVFTVTPTADISGNDMVATDNNITVLQVRNADNVQGAYDRNENGIDGTVPQTVRCVGTLTPAQLMPGVVANASWAAQGGWGYLQAIAGANQNGAVVYQIDRSNAAGKFMSSLTSIVSDPD